MTTQSKSLKEKEATKLLHQLGFTWSGRPRKEVDLSQCAFERKLIMAGHCGKSTAR